MWPLTNAPIRLKITGAALVLAALAAFLLLDTASAQEATEYEYVDLAVTLEIPDQFSQVLSQHLNIIVVNQGSRTAYDVEVVVDVENPALGYYQIRFVGETAPRVPVGTSSLENAGRRLRWSIPALGGLQREEVRVYVVHKSTETGSEFDNSSIPHEYFGEVTTSSFESDIHKGNNTSRVWSYRYDEPNQKYRQAAGNYTVAVTVDDPSPSPGDTVNFTITADRTTPTDYSGTDVPPIDAKVNIELTDGLSATGTPTYLCADLATCVVPTQVSYSNGVFDIGTLKARESTRNSVTLPVLVASDAVVNEQCLTATLTGNPPPGIGPIDDDISDNVAKLCLGIPSEKRVYESGTVAAWTIHACKSDVSANECDTVDEVDVHLVASTDDSGKVDLTQALIHIKDVPGRVLDSHTQSVTGGTTVSWQTATLEDSGFTGTRNGVTIGIDRRPINDYITNWTNFSLTFVASDLNGSDPPGKLAIRSRSNGNGLWTSTMSDPWTFARANPFGLSSQSTVVTTFMIEFEKLGTYVLDVTADLTHASLQDADSNPRVFSRTSKTYFHVGPIAELGVSDGGARSEASSDQVAFTVVGINNRDENAENGKIVVELPAGTTGLTTVPASTGTFDGTASPPTWAWDIHDLELAERRASKGLPEGEFVTLIVDGVTAGETATANIVYDLYEVCIDGSGADVDADNQADCKTDSGNTNVWYAAVCVNTANNEIDSTITVEATCDSTTDREWTEDVCASSGGDVLSPSTEGTCYGWYAGTVLDYDADNNTATLTAQAGTGGGQGAPTLLSAEDPGPSITVTWDAVDYVHGVPVTHYEVQRQTNPWMTLANDVEGTEYVDTDVNPGDTFEYRVRAVNGAGVEGPWSAPMKGTVPVPETASAGAPDAPVLTASLPDGADGRSQIDLAWDKPVENGAPITSYTLEVSDGSNGPWATPDPAPQLGGSDTSWSHTGLTGGARKYYRMKATNSRGDSDWSAVIEATTRAPGKAGPPTNVRAVPDGDAAIDVSWDPPLDDGGSPITYYEVQWSPDGASGWRNAGRTTDAETRTFKNTGMSFGTTRYYRIAARNGVTLGDWSDPPASATTLAGVPGQPNLTARPTDANTIALTWTVPADNGSAIIRYELEHSPDGADGSWISLTSPVAADTSYSDTGLDPGTLRYYRIRAVNGATPGEGSWSTVRSATTPAAVPGAPPCAPRPTARTPSTSSGNRPSTTAAPTSPATSCTGRRTAPRTATPGSPARRHRPAPTPTAGYSRATHGTTGFSRATGPAPAGSPSPPLPPR